MAAYRFLASLAALLAFLLLSVLYVLGDSHSYAGILEHWGIVPFAFPFVDMSGALAAWECTRLGVDVIEHDPCDVLGRGYTYSPFWMAGSGIPLGILSAGVVGWVVDMLFLVSLVFLPPVRRPWELALVVLATLSTMVAFALERSNPDIILFMLAVLAGLLAQRSLPVRLLAYLVALFAASLKYYPITLMVLPFRERIPVFLAVNLAALSLIALFVGFYFSDLGRGIPLIASGPYYTDLFAAKNLPFAIAEVLQHPTDASPSPAPLLSLAVILYAVLVLIGAAISWRILRSGRLRSTLAALTPHEAIFLVIGSAVIVGCFFAGQNIGYRGIYLLMALPGLLAVWRNATGMSRAISAGTSVIIVFLMWGECFRHALSSLDTAEPSVVAALVVFWFFREFAWWWTISVMAAILVNFFWESETRRGTASMLGRYLGWGRVH